jgi:hypothetical protein
MSCHYVAVSLGHWFARCCVTELMGRRLGFIGKLCFVVLRYPGWLLRWIFVGLLKAVDLLVML